MRSLHSPQMQQSPLTAAEESLCVATKPSGAKNKSKNLKTHTHTWSIPISLEWNRNFHQGLPGPTSPLPTRLHFFPLSLWLTYFITMFPTCSLQSHHQRIWRQLPFSVALLWVFHIWISAYKSLSQRGPFCLLWPGRGSCRAPRNRSTMVY